jgi:trehalose synthase
LDDYRPIVGEQVVERVRELAAPLRGARVVHVNPTAFGGGVAEILHTLVPLMRDVGLDAEWRLMEGSDEFFNVTKAFHNALQGADLELTAEMREIYLRYNEQNARAFQVNHDFVIIHDPQPAAMLHFHGRQGDEKWIWRCHIDTSTPNRAVWDFMEPFLALYDAGIFTLEQYVAGGLHYEHLAIIPPSIDPLSPKNVAMPREQAQAILRRYGVDTERPLVTQVSRFDPWKDPLGVIEAYRIAKRRVPGLQLALVGSMAHDDPEGWIYYDRTLRRAGEDFDIYILHNFHGVGDVEVNAFQTASDVIVQKSIREGFGLVVAEAMWKGQAVVGGNAGGIPLQIVDGETGFLVESVEACAEKILWLLEHPREAKAMGKRARERVRRHFLSTRHLADYLELFRELVESS